MNYDIPMTSLRMVREQTLTVPEIRIQKLDDAARVATSLIGDRPVEHVIAMMLDGRGTLISVVTIAIGGPSAAVFTTPDVLRAVLISGARAFILAHNHPGGDPTPSEEDIRTTAHIEKASFMLGVPMLSHIVVTMTGATAAILT